MRWGKQYRATRTIRSWVSRRDVECAAYRYRCMLCVRHLSSQAIPQLTTLSNLHLGILRLHQTQLLRYQLHHPPPKFLPSRPHHQRRSLARHIRRYPGSHPRRIHPTTADAVSRDSPWKPAAGRLSHHEYQSVSHAAAMCAVVPRGTRGSCCGCGACV